jgi:hypothetical protein
MTAVTTQLRNLFRLERRKAPRTASAWERPVGLLANLMVPIWLALNLSDALLTRHGLGSGIAVELNPLYRAMAMSHGDMVKAGATLVCLALIWRLRRHSIYTASIALGALCAWLLFINIWNLCLLI